MFLDLDYGSGKYFAISKSPQSMLRTRIRVGFAVGQNPKTVQEHLNINLTDYCCGECFDSPLQYGDIVKIGALALYPVEINLKAMEKELMCHFDFQYPIALRKDWVNQPSGGSNKQRRGVLLLDVFNRRCHSRAIDLECFSWLQPHTPNKELPQGAQVHYVRDWKAAMIGGIINARADSQLRDLITTVVDKVTANRAITTVLYSQI